MEKKNEDADMFESNKSMSAREIPQSLAAEVIVAKQRNGATGTVKLTLCPESAPFDNDVPFPA